jgi:gliding motility-associated-like protein
MPTQPEIVPSQPNLYSGLSYNLQVKEPNSDEQYGWYKSTLYANVDGPTFPIKILSAIDTGNYTVKVTNQQGCYVWSDAYTLNLSKTALFIPNIFTPNGDGINDYLQIIGLDEFVENQLEILNKHGNIVFSQKNYHNSWDGGGLPNDIYYYTLELKRQDGTNSSLNGYVHLKR